MAIKVTFDTNVFKRLLDFSVVNCCDDLTYFQRIRAAIEKNIIEPYFSDTFILLEGIMHSDRVKILGSRKIDSVTRSEITSDTINISIGASMQKPTIHESHKLVVVELLQLGFRALRGQTYLGDNFIVPVDLDIYPKTPIDELIKIREKMVEVEVAVGSRNLETGKNIGKCRARELGLKRLERDGRSGEIWYQGLALCEGKEVIEAVKEWADGESVMRHIGYDNDYFCTLDEGKSAKGPSIFDSEHKQWLSCKFGVKFTNPRELSEILF